LLANLGDFEEWSKGKPASWVQVIAFRNSLRVLPLMAKFDSYEDLSPDQKAETYLATLRAAHSSWAVLRYPEQVSSTYALRASRSASRIIGQSAGVSGAVEVARLCYSISDAAYCIAQSDPQFAIRSIRNIEEYCSSVDEEVRGSIWDDISLDVERITDKPSVDWRRDVKFVASKKLWRRGRPEWARIATASLSSSMNKIGGRWDVWLDWYSARLRGVPDFNLSSSWAEEIGLRMSQQDDEWWVGGFEHVNSTISVWIDEAQAEDASSRSKTISGFVLNYLENKGEDASLTEIIDAFDIANFPVIPKSVRGELSRLASSGQVRRVAPGVYRSALLPEEVGRLSLGSVEPQTKGAVQFEARDDRPIEVKRRGSAGELRDDLSAQRRHKEVLRRADQLLADYVRTSQGGNASARLLEEVALFKDSLGGAIEELDPDLLIPRGDGLRRDLNAYQNRDEFSVLPPAPDDLILALGKLVSDYNNFVSFDPELARRDEALLGPDARRRLVPPEEGQKVLVDAVARHAAHQDVVDILAEEAKVAPIVPDPDSRQSRRYSEGAKNFARIAIEMAYEYAIALWRNKRAIAAGGVFVLTSSYAAAQWVLGNQAWLISYFSENRVMLEIITNLVRILEKLPLA